MNLLELVDKFIFTPTCFICTKTLPFTQELPYICDKCSVNPHLIKMKICEICGKPRDVDPLMPACPYCNGNKLPFNSYIAPFYYEGAIKSSIIDYKFSGKFGNAKSFAYFIALKMKHLDYLKPEVIISAPSSRKRLILRGYDHILLLAKMLSKITDIPYDKILVKVKHTKPQSTLSQKERYTNLKDAFDVKPHEYKSVLLLDDIYTTGSTVKELCRVLKKSGVKEIHVATIAYTYYAAEEGSD